MEKSENTSTSSTSKPFFKKVCTYFREYCNCTGIHGFRYFGEKRSIFERVWWSIIFTICLAICISSIYGVYKKWEASPVIVNFANQGTPIYKIPFPAITICPESKSSQDKFNYTKILQKKRAHQALTSEESTVFTYMSLICVYSSLNQPAPDFFPEDFFDVVNRVKSNLTLLSCTYLGQSTNCSALFTPIFTDVGICYTFNMLDRSDIYKDTVLQFEDYLKNPNITHWSMEHGFSHEAAFTTYPRRALYPGASNGLSFSIETPADVLDYACRGSAPQGYKVMLHSPMRIPRPSQQYFRVPLDQIVMGAVQPVMISTSDRVKMYNPSRRGCYFPSERNLTYFKIYTSLNCKLECLTKHTLDSCGCVNFYMPRENGTEICGTGQIWCMKRTERYLQARDLYHKMSENTSIRAECDCLPLCTDVTYEVETSQTDWDWKKVYQAYSFPVPNRTHLSSLTIFFKTDNFVTSDRNELYGPIDFLANFGGILGLFTGFSVLSLMEILYFLSIRLICNSRLYGNWAGQEL